MEKLEMVQKVMECTGSSFADAKEALEATEYDVLEAIVLLEKAGKSKSAFVGETSEQKRPPKGERFRETWENLMGSFRRVCRTGIDTSFVAERKGRQVFTMPVLLFVVLCILAFWVCIPLLVVGLFFDFRYRFQGVESVSIDVNAIADKAADFANNIKQEASGTDTREASRA